jgi:hypothetical protein
MKTAKGSFCGKFQQPATPFQSAPFFGQYSRTGGRGTSTTPGTGTVPGATPATPGAASGAGGQGVGGTPTTANPSTQYPPSAYESPPQVVPGNNGNGKGNGNGKANKGGGTQAPTGQ